MARTKANKGKGVKYGHELAQRTRGAILSAFDALDREGKVISEILAEQFKDNPLRFLDTAAKYLPRDVNLTTFSEVDASKLSDDELAEVIADRARYRKEQIAADIRSSKADVPPASPIKVINSSQ